MQQDIQASIKSKKNTAGITAQGLFFILLLAIAEFYESGLIKGWYLTAIIISAGIAMLGLIIYIGRQNCYTFASAIDKYIYIFPILIISIQWILYAVYNICLYVIGVGNILYMKSSCIQELIPLVIIVGAGAACYIFRKNTIKYLQYTIWINYFMIFAKWICTRGIESTIKGAASIFSGLSIFNPFETYSGMNYAIGLLVIYYLSKDFHPKAMRLKYGVPLIILTFLNGKRSVYLALGIILVSSFFLSKLKNRTKHRYQMVISTLLILAYLLYIYLIDNGLFFEFAYSGKINFMGRLQMWNYIAEYIDFTPLFFGKGYSFSTLTLEKNSVWTYKGAIYSMHGDILAMYTDLGFWIFIFWMVYNLIIIPKIFRKKYGYHMSDLYWNLTAYLFILYLTERAANIFILQTMYIILIIQGIKEGGGLYDSFCMQLSCTGYACNPHENVL